MRRFHGRQDISYEMQLLKFVSWISPLVVCFQPECSCSHNCLTAWTCTSAIDRDLESWRVMMGQSNLEIFKTSFQRIKISTFYHFWWGSNLEILWKPYARKLRFQHFSIFWRQSNLEMLRTSFQSIKSATFQHFGAGQIFKCQKIQRIKNSTFKHFWGWSNIKILKT